MRTRTGWRVKTLGSLIGLWLLIGLPSVAIADSVSISWDRNLEEDLAGYKVYFGMLPGAYTETIDVGYVTTYTVSDLVPGETYFFALTAYDVFANESNYSTEISTTIPLPIVPGPQDITTPTSEDQGTPAPTTTGGLWTWLRKWLRNLLF